jgi:outer membrane assembly lipoprotein YfgL
LAVRSAWTSSVGAVGFALGVRVVGNSVYVAGTEGVVAAIDARTGGDIWRTALKTKLTAGVGSDGRYAAVVNRENELITLDAGKVLWRQQLGALTLTAPLVAGERVFVLSADRSVAAFDVATGRKLWQQQRTGDALVLGQAGVLMAVGDTLVAGLSGRLVGMNPQNGTTRWEAAIATSRGTNEVERLVDLVAGVSREGDSVCVRSFQSAVGCVDTSRGRTVWTKTANGAAGVHGDASILVGTESDGKMIAWKRADGDKLWTSERLRYRGLSTPLWLGKSIVVGDESGLVHFVSPEDGSLLNRVSTDGSAAAAAPVLAGSTLVIVTRRGGVYAFRPD